MKISKYKQKTRESCLASCLLMVLKSKGKIKAMSKKEELKILSHALNFSKRNFVIGHLDYVARKYGARVEFYVEKTSTFNMIKKIRFSKNIMLVNKKIDKKTIKSDVGGLAILYVDAFGIYGVHHYPHFVLIVSEKNGKINFIDPWDGKAKSMKSEKILKAVDTLRRHIKLSPSMIIIR